MRHRCDSGIAMAKISSSKQRSGIVRMIRNSINRSVFMAAIFLLASCNKAPTPASHAKQPREDFLRANMDFTVNPGDDFFTYANGAWLKAHPIPASEAGWGIGNVVREELYINLRKINEDSAKANAAAGTDRQKIGDFWSTAMDSEKAERLGMGPLQAELDRIAAIKNAGEAMDVAFALQTLGVGAFFDFSVAQDEKNSDEMSVHLYQGGLGLPDRDYYFNPEAGVAKARSEYVAHLGRMLKLIGQSEENEKAAADIMALETALAKASRKLEDLRDPQRNYNKMTPADFTRKHTPSIAWSTRLAAWNLKPAYVIIGQPEFFTALDAVLKKTPAPVLKNYLRFHLVSTYAESLNQAIDNENFSFYKQALSGQKEQRPRWKRVLDAEDAAMGMILGRIFVKEYFPDATKKRYSDLVEAIRTAYSERIARLDWMSEATKAKAQQKLATVIKKVGCPDKWKDYSALMMSRDSYCQNMIHAAKWHFSDMVSKFGKPVDRTEWTMKPQTYNAEYNPANNEIILPAAIFAIPGVKDADVDDAVVYGYAGASTIGHEMTHGFDDEGRQYDAHGNLTDWWTEDDAAKFKQHADIMIKQFDIYEPLPGLHINGKASLGENIADYGGVLLGLEAFKKTEQYKIGEKIGGLTPIQRFFLGYALGWLYQQREERLRRSLLSDVHAPAKWRVLGPLSNIPQFYEAFGVKPGQPLWRAADACAHIW
jgi:putative endopeptidase